MDAGVDEGLARISRLVAHLLRVPVSLVSLVDDRRQFFAAATGFDVEPWASRRGTPLSHSFCKHVVCSGEALVVPDAREDPVMAGNSAIEDLGVVAYLGVPVRSPEGLTLGSLCAIDGSPRTWTDDDRLALTDLAALVEEVIGHREAAREASRLAAELREESRTDLLTGLANRRRWEELAPLELARALRHGHPLSVVYLDLDDFKALNDTKGHAAGDAVLQSVARRWRQLVRAPDLLARVGGDEFAVLLGGPDEAEARAAANRLIEAAAPDAVVSAGVAQWRTSETLTDLSARADADLYASKRARRPPR